MTSMLARMTAVSAALMLCVALSAAPTVAQDISGTWVLSVELDFGSGDATFVFEQDGETLTGTYSGALGEHTVTGTIEGNEVSFQFTEDQVGTVTYRGTVDGDTMMGSCDYGLMGGGSFVGSKRESAEIG